jgi:hypothetical protein
MGNLVNLRHARKTKARVHAEKDVAANRLKYGTSKAFRKASAAEKERADRAIESHKIKRD